MTRLIDLSHAVRHGLVTYPGLPAPVIGEHLSRSASRAHYAPGTEFQIGRIELVANTGTYVDAPFHRFAAGADLARLPLESLADLPGLLLRVPARVGRAIGPESLTGLVLAAARCWCTPAWTRTSARRPTGPGTRS